MSVSQSFRLIPLDGHGHGESMTVGTTTEISPGVQLTIADDLGNAILERRSLRASGGEGVQAALEVSVDAVPVFEVAHYRAGQLLQVGQSRFVLLKPLGVFVRDDDKARRWRSLLGMPRGESNVVSMFGTPLSDLPLQQTKLPLQAMSSSMTPASQAPAAGDPAGKRRPILAISAVAIVMVGGALALIPEMPGEAPAQEQRSTETAETQSLEVAPSSRAASAAPIATVAGAPTTPAAETEDADVVSADNHSRAATSVESDEGPARTRDTSQQESTPVASDGATKALDTSGVASQPAQKVGKGASIPPRPSTPDKRKVVPQVKSRVVDERKPVAELPAEKISEVRFQIESYQLEAGYDPESALQKLRALKDRVPAGHALRSEIDQAIGRVRR